MYIVTHLTQVISIEEAKRILKEDMMHLSSNQIQQSISDDKRAPRIFTTRNGVQLRLRSVSPFLVLEAQKRIVKPTEPMWYNEAKSREEPNPLDPNYVRAVDDYNTKMAELVNDTYLANGVTLLPNQPLPESIPDIDSEDWAEGIKYSLGADVPHSGIGRRVLWLKYCVVTHVEDLGDLIAAISVASGLVSEEQVQQAVESFRDNQERSTDNNDQNPPESINRNSAVSDTRDGE